jgi:hypothetical protein
MPVISLIAFEDRAARFIFVRVPDDFGRYVRTDACVALVPCERCGATIGEPCKSWGKKPGRYHGATHALRREAAGQTRRKGRAHKLECKDVIDPADGATVTIKAEEPK